MAQQEMSQAERENAAKAVYSYAADLMKRGQSDQAIQIELVAKGLSPDVAMTIINNLRQVRSQGSGSSAMKNMLIGAAIAIVGIVITVGTYASAASTPGGGRYVVFYGLIIVGAIQFLRGLFGLFTGR